MPLNVWYVPKFDKTLFCTSFKCPTNCTPLNWQIEIKIHSEFALFTTVKIVFTKLYHLFANSTSYSISLLKRVWEWRGWLNIKYWPSFVKRKTLLLCLSVKPSRFKVIAWRGKRLFATDFNKKKCHTRRRQHCSLKRKMFQCCQLFQLLMA